MEKRLQWHLKGGTRSTKGMIDWEIVFLQTTVGRREAMQLESTIKKTKSRRSINRFITDTRNELRQAKSLTEFLSGCSAAW